MIDRRASVTLAFVAAMQLLPATQRAALILRDVLCWSSREVAELLDTTVAAVNSALQRARTTLAATSATSAATTPLGDHELRVVDAFVRAWAACDMTALAALLREDAIMAMPPQSIRIVGRDKITAFLQRAVHGSHRGVEQFGYLSARPAEHVAQDQCCPLGGGQ